jgi:hypothetical protein
VTIRQAIQLPAVDPANVATPASGRTQISDATNGQVFSVKRPDGTTVNVESGALMQAFTVATVPAAAVNVNRYIIVTDEVGGLVPAFSDGTDWRRCTDRAVIST